MIDRMERKIEKLIEQMTIEEKIGQLNQASYITANLEALKGAVRKGNIGAFVLSSSCFAGNDDQEAVMREELNQIQKVAMEESRMQIPVIFGRDTIHGYKTIYPIPLAMAASYNMDLVFEAYRYTAIEASADGIRWAFTPMLDVARDPRWGRVIETPGEDPYLGAQIARAAITGLQGSDPSGEDSMAACAKHYVGYGACEGGRDYFKTEISEYTLRNNYLCAFQEAVKCGVATVMSAFNEIGGVPVTCNSTLIKDILKKEFRFDGFVVSDWASVARLLRQGVAEDEKQCASLALNGGVDMDMVSGCYKQYIQEQLGREISMEKLNEAVRRVLRIKLRFGLFEHPYTKEKTVKRQKLIDKAREIADESMVLLKNERRVLPLKAGKSIALVGPMANVKRPLLGSWSLDGSEDNVVTLKEGITAAAKERGIEVFTSEREMHDEMLRAAAMADVVVLALGESHMVTGEARCLVDISLPPEQKALVRRIKALGKQIVGVMCFGRPIALADVEADFDAIVYAWHCGEQTGNAVADILFGQVNPSGKLPITFPRATGQIPIYYNVPSNGKYYAGNGGKPVNGYYGQTVNYDDCPGTPLYPFGFGLSYTSFTYDKVYTDREEMCLEDLRAGNSIMVSAAVKNVGTVAGKETVQCYVYDPCASMTRPMRELKGFSKILLHAGEKRVVSFSIGEKELGFYNGKGWFTVEKGRFFLYIGSDCTTKNCISIQVT